MVFKIPVALSGFPGTDSMQVWATYGTDADCVFGGRGQSGTAPTCWLVDRGPGLPNGSTSYTATIPVRALVAPEDGSIPPAGTLEGDQGPDACTHQSSFAGLPITIWFLPITSTGNVDPAGAPYQYPSFTADLVGPPAPQSVNIQDGDTEMTVQWASNSDGDTQGYDVFIDPPPGSHPEGGTSVLPEVLYCMDTGAPIVSSSDAEAASSDEASADDSSSDDGALGEEASEDASGDVSVDAPVEATSEAASPASDGAASADATLAVSAFDGAAPDGCVYASGGQGVPLTSGDAGCVSAALTLAPVFSAGYVTDSIDDSGTVDLDASSSSNTSLGGMASLTCEYLEGGSCSAGSFAYTNTGNPSVTGVGGSSLTISSLTNGVMYNVVVAAVDGSGNVGPQSSPLVCDYPAPINDFYKTYRLDGGSAGGGFCTLEAVGAPTGASIVSFGFGALAFGLVRRRKKR
jgi:hypothetical protein